MTLNCAEKHQTLWTLLGKFTISFDLVAVRGQVSCWFQNLSQLNLQNELPCMLYNIYKHQYNKTIAHHIIEHLNYTSDWVMLWPPCRQSGSCAQHHVGGHYGVAV